MDNITKPNLKRLTQVAVIIAFAIFGCVMINISRASGNASLALSPASGTYNVNTNFTVSIYENSGAETASSVDVKLNYDASKLQFVSVSTAGSPFTFCPESAGGSGAISVVCTKLGGSTTGNQLVASITFHTLAGSGSTALSFGSNSHILRDTDNADLWNGSTGAGSYNLATPASPAPPTSSSGGSTGQASSGSTASSTSTAPRSTKSNTPTTAASSGNTTSTGASTSATANNATPTNTPTQGGNPGGQSETAVPPSTVSKAETTKKADLTPTAVKILAPLSAILIVALLFFLSPHLRHIFHIGVRQVDGSLAGTTSPPVIGNVNVTSPEVPNSHLTERLNHFPTHRPKPGSVFTPNPSDKEKL